jgi:membrane associated rhomboid family serine protease
MKRITYNSPVILTFALCAIAVLFIDRLSEGFIDRFFMAPSRISWETPVDYFRLASHILGHSDWAHLFGNLVYILLLGPILEEKYGSLSLLLMILFTAFVTGITNVTFFSSGLMGASGIVFMLIILVSIVDIKSGTIPLTFILVACFFIGTEALNALRNDQIAQMAHIIGGVTGAIFGFSFAGLGGKT